jgi:hypothetical protein
VVDPEFSEIFSDVAAITKFVGHSKAQLRRAIAIRGKWHYKDPAFSERLREQWAAMNLAIAIDEGKIVPTSESCRDVFQAPLDHRLDSRLSLKMYDVRSTEPVA